MKYFSVLALSAPVFGGLIQFDSDEDQLVGANDCTWGPSHWCSSEEVAERCETVSYCQKQNLGVYALELVLDEEPIVGADECTWGPSHWCSSEATAENCDVVSYCQEQNLGVYAAILPEIELEEEPLEGADECTWGPSHWCSSKQVAKKCNVRKYCKQNNLGVFANNNNKAKSYGYGGLGFDECTWGPTHWCSDKKVAARCNVTNYCQKKRLGVFA